jgi:hypothetical protein
MDDLLVYHRHPDGPVEMRHVRRERLDPVEVSHLRCECGSRRAVLSRLGQPETADGPWAWPPRHQNRDDVPS